MPRTAVLTQTAASPPDVHDSPHFLVQSQLDHDSRRGPGSQSSLSREYGSSEDIGDDQRTNLSRTRAVILITTLTGITFVGSMSTGLLTIGLPWIAADLGLPENYRRRLLSRPSSVYS
ncbi:hypothetical protein BDV36DRAFT_249212 [Aspergillus pseudocaelatus]|uniref:Major facilitator superfamily (MFS) profile domain-containing protein n=1 Tax=Aspergillus pseudocaelatus TaxID=1825620 RepID=A0ABQ6WU21_9EURO|nr:hypothetical protein BDV36DRAFT_249212 [Aspergillus pseudocaelatus]